MKKLKALSLVLAMIVTLTACTLGEPVTTTAVMDTTMSTETTESSEKSTSDQPVFVSSGKSPEEILASLSLEDKASQMVQGAVYRIDKSQMEEYDYGSVLSNLSGSDAKEWREYVLELQTAALSSKTGIPYLYGNDAVHGSNAVLGTVIFPHNINIGAANDEALTLEMGRAVADEMKLTGVLWNFSPCVAQAADPRWGRTYESYSSNLEIIKTLAVAYSKGLIEGGILPCAKHFFADGNVKYGTGECSDVARIIDRGNAVLTDAEIEELLSVYKALIDAGVMSIMISHSSVNGVKMHENAKYIQMLKEEYGFSGVIISDWNSIHNITGQTLKEQTITAVNSGIDMLMEPDTYDDCRQYIMEGVNEGAITMSRVDDAVLRILQMKKNLGVLDDPMQEKVETVKTETGSEEYRALALELAEKSLVLLKNENDILPLKEGSKLFITGPAANDTGVQCGGWTVEWSGRTDLANGKIKWVKTATTILEGFEALADEYGYEIITDEAEATNADAVILCVGETPYAEWEGDTEDLSITGSLGLYKNKASIELAESLNLPTIACIVAGRNVIIDEYDDNWNGIVMCYLPGSEGACVANVLSGKKTFTGKLPMPYYASVNDIESGKAIYEQGYGLTINR